MSLILIVLIVGLALMGELWWRRNRLRRETHPAGFERTDEVFTDPTTGVRERVWFNPATGERHYEVEAPPERPGP